MALWNESCLASWRSGWQASCLVWQKLQRWILHINCTIKSCHTCLAYRLHWLLPLSTDLDLAWGSQGQCKAKPIGFIFSHTFQLIKMKFDVVMKQFKQTSWDYILVSFIEIREITAVLLTVSKSFNTGMQSDVYESISFKLCMMIDTIILYILFSVSMTLTFIQGHSCIRNQYFGVHFLTNLNIDLDEIQYVATACLLRLMLDLLSFGTSNI